MSISRPPHSYAVSTTGTYTPNAGGTSATLVGMPPPTQSSSGTSNLEVYDEGVLLTPGATLMNFTGAGVTATAVGTAVTVNVPLGASAVVMDNVAATTYPTAPQTQGVWYGSGTKAGTFDNNCTAVGNAAVASSTGCTASGKSASASDDYASAYGYLATASAGSSVALGGSSAASATGATCLGPNTVSSGPFSISGGQSAHATGYSAVAFGNSSVSSGDASLAFGQVAIANVDNGVAIGKTASTNSIASSIVLNASGALRSPNDTAHALAIGINPASYVAGTSLGVTINGTSELINLGASSAPTYNSTATAAGTTSLTAAAKDTERFSGSTTQTVELPNTSTLTLGRQIKIVNDSSNAVSANANVTVNTFGSAATVTTLAGAQPASNRGGWGYFQCVDIAGANTAAEWSYQSGATIL